MTTAMEKIVTEAQPAAPTAPNVPAVSIAPAVRIVRGHPDDVELAALVAGLAASGSEEDEHPGNAPAAWSDRSRLLPRAARPVGPDAWRWSLR